LIHAVQTPLAPAAVGPYSQAIKANGFLFVSGCIGLVPSTKALVSVNDIELQTRQALNNLKSIVIASGCTSLQSVCKTTIMLTDMSHFAIVNKIYSEYFPPMNDDLSDNSRQSSPPPPSRSTFAVAKLPLEALIEIEAVAVLS